MNRIIELTWRLADGELTPGEEEELQRLIGGDKEVDKEALAAYLSILQLEAGFRGLRREAPVRDAATAAAIQEREDRLVRGVLSQVGVGRKAEAAGDPAPRARTPRDARPLGVRLLWLLLPPLAVAGAVILVTGRMRKTEVAPLVADEAPSAQAIRGGTTPRTASEAGAKPIAYLRSVSGKTFIVEDGQKVPATAGRDLAGGEGMLAAGRQSGGEIVFADGSQVELAGNTQAWLLRPSGPAASKTVFLASGSLNARIVEQPSNAPFIFLTAHARAKVLGTRLTLSVTADDTKLAVSEGRVQLTGNNGKSVEVKANEQALMNDVLAAPDKKTRARALFIVKDQNLNSSETAIKQLLYYGGFEVLIRPAGPDLAADALSSRLIVISSTINSTAVNTQLTDVPVPLVTWETSLFDHLGMTGAVHNLGGGEVGGLWFDHVVITDPSHPLAGGLSNTVRISTASHLFGWGRPSPLAIWVATVKDDPTAAAVFAYEAGAAMVGDKIAPARRVGLFLGDDTAGILTEEGWALVHAAINWAITAPKP